MPRNISMAAVAIVTTALLASLLIITTTTTTAIASAATVVTKGGTDGFELTLHLRARQGGEDELERTFWNVATPGHSEYLRHRSRTELAAIVGASRTDLKTARNWLRTLGGTNIRLSPLGNTLTAYFSNLSGVGLAASAEQWTARGLPSRKGQPEGVELVTRRDFVGGGGGGGGGGGQRHPQHQQEQSQSQSKSQRKTHESAAAAAAATVSAPRAMYSVEAQKKGYGIPADLQASNAKTLQMVWGPGTFGYSPSELASFKEQECPLLNLDKVRFDTEHHGRAGGDNFGEGNLDTRQISAFGLNISTLVSNTNTSMSTEEGQGFGLAMLDFVTQLAGRTTLPQVLSLSLGSLSAASCDLLCSEAAKLPDDPIAPKDCRTYLQTQRQVCMFISTAQVARINQGLKLLGLRGVSVFGSSGDGGSHWSFEQFPSDTPIGRALNKVGCAHMFPIFPSPSPYMVSVGGTQWRFGSPKLPEAWPGSGGGFSWQFAAPAHQQKTVANYLATTPGLPPAAQFNGTNRAYPDVSAVAVDGTSESSPTMAGIFSLLTDARLNAGLPPLGFVAPRIWQVAESFPGAAFEDVTKGNSKTSCETGFPAAQGWDPVTGWGRPVWAGLLKHFASDAHIQAL